MILILFPPQNQENRIPGRWEGQIRMSDDFNEEDEEIIKLFYGDESEKY